MALINPIQPSFSGGEYSPSIYPRVDIEKYRTGLKTCRNFYIHPHGGASNRPGTLYMATAKHEDKTTIVRSFVFSSTQAYILEIGDHYIRFFTDQATVPMSLGDAVDWSTSASYTVNDWVTYNASIYLCVSENGSTAEPPETYPTVWSQQLVYEIWTPYAEADLYDLRLEGSADVIYVTHPDYQPRTLSRYNNADWRLELYAPNDGPFMIENLTATTITANALTANATLTSSTGIFYSTHVGSLWKLRHYIEGQTASEAFSSATTGTAIKCFTTWRLVTHGTWTGKLKIEKSADGSTDWTALRTFSSADEFNVNTSGTEDIEINPDPFYVRLNMYSYTSGTCNADLTTDAFYQDGICKVLTYNSATSVATEVIKDIGSTSATDSWSEGSWSDRRGYPAVSRFYQDRLCFAGTYSEPMTIWMTQTGNYTSFLRHSPLLDTDGITTNLPSRQLNAINGLIALKRLIAFTSSSEWTIGSQSSSALTPLNVEQSVEGYRGSYGVNPVLVGNEVMYVQSNGKVIRNLGYDLGTDSFTGAELNILAKHLFDKWNIIDMAYQQDPDSIVWCLRDDGVLLGMTYMREQEVVAWFWVDTGTVADNDVATIESIATIPGEGYDELWMSVKRGDHRFIEVMTKRIAESDCIVGGKRYLSENAHFVDCGVFYGNDPVYITAITLSSPTTVVAQAHGFSNNQTIRLDSITSWETLNGTTWTIGNATINTFDLLTQVVSST
jgi:hypothetical protein